MFPLKGENLSAKSTNDVANEIDTRPEEEEKALLSVTVDKNTAAPKSTQPSQKAMEPEMAHTPATLISSIQVEDSDLVPAPPPHGCCTIS